MKTDLEKFLIIVGSVVYEAQNKMYTWINEINRSFPIEEKLRELISLLQSLSGIDWKTLRSHLDELPEESKKAMKRASSSGWFFSWNDSLQEIMLLIRRINNIDDAYMDELMIEHHRKNFTDVTNRLLKRYPNREIIIKAALGAHVEPGSSGYFLSIPVFISQADGLLGEILKIESPMGKYKEKEEIKASEKLIQQLAMNQESLDLVFPLLILGKSDLLKSSKARKNSVKSKGVISPTLNRHQVMHGESLDYGTEVNSWKAFSFLAFIGDHLPMVLEQASTKTTLTSPHSTTTAPVAN